MLITKEDQILDPQIRAKIIQEIDAPENKRRKDEMYRRYEIHKDRVYKYVVQKLITLFDIGTVNEMSYAIANVSIARKIVDKLARVYSNGVTREVVNQQGVLDETSSKQLDDLYKYLNMNTIMKKANRSYKRDKNAMFYAKPLQEEDGKYCVQPTVLFPFLYDVIEDPNDREEPMVVILSHYEPSAAVGTPAATSEVAAKHITPLQIPQLQGGNRRDESIADSPEDSGANKKEYIWWSDNYHFTTNAKGEITSQSGTENMIKELPFENFAEDQDGCFWATGGEDVADGAVLVNSMLTHMAHVGVVQGYGQFYMTGKNLPRNVKIGPSRGITMEYEKDDPKPEMGFLNANAPLADLRSNLEMYVALMLTTNNLSVSGIATQLGKMQTAAAGISLIIDKAESMEDVQDQQQIFVDKEPAIARKIIKWINAFKAKGVASDDIKQFSLKEDLMINIKFQDSRPIMSEGEKLDAIQKRQDLHLNTQEELLMMDNPHMTKQQAQEKVKEIKKQQSDNIAQMQQGMMNGDQSGQGGGNPQANGNGVQPGPGGDTQGPTQ